MSMIERLRMKIRGLRLTFMEHLELDELLISLERERGQLLQRIKALEDEVKRLREKPDEG